MVGLGQANLANNDKVKIKGWQQNS